MRTQFSKFALTAALMLAITFTFSCSSPDDDNNGGNNNGNGNGGSNTPSAGPCPNAVTSDGSMSCGGQTYKTVQIGDQVWMAANLNYNVSGSKCYGNAESDCNKFGRLYDWETAKKVCPSGWHLPSVSDWDDLKSYVENDNGCGSCAGKHLKARNGWNIGGNGTDTYDFAALPGGYGYSSGGFHNAGDNGFWWTSTEYDANLAHYRSMGYNIEYVNSNFNFVKSYLFSVRCLKD
ncbi:MAG: fibrobacter succinogenes major paralogous domain-containing protein [Fibromonadaceae bacterium]|jgi:uncharacterized protein (TIGR02145 family)|nr:fibrobacter succinogenes major paralogous domain-containing protein [Fibromonadaceae bacterium]